MEGQTHPCDHQPFIAKAPFVLVFLADYARMMAFYEASAVPDLLARQGETMLRPREFDLLLACCDALIAAQTVVTAAESLGLGSCHIGDVMENWEKHRRLLELPKYAFPITTPCVGWPTAQQRARPQPSRPQLSRPQPSRLDRSLIVHKNRYRMPGREELPSIFAGGEELDNRIRRSGRSLWVRRGRKYRHGFLHKEIFGFICPRDAQERFRHARELALKGAAVLPPALFRKIGAFSRRLESKAPFPCPGFPGSQRASAPGPCRSRHGKRP